MLIQFQLILMEMGTVIQSTTMMTEMDLPISMKDGVVLIHWM